MALGLQIAKTGKTCDLVSVQHQYDIDLEGHPSDFASDTAFRRDLVQIGTLDDFRKNPAFAQNEENRSTTTARRSIQASNTMGMPGVCPST